MDATIACLLEHGYSGTTTPLVAKRAGVTRGAMLHHYPSREALVTAAVRHLAIKRVEEALELFGGVDSKGDALPRALDLLWQMHQGPLFAAVTELWVAARTDAALAAQVESVEQVVLSSTATGSTAPAGVPAEVVNDLVFTSMDAIRGLLISCYGTTDPRRAESQWPRLRRHLLRLTEAELAAARTETAAR